MPTSKRKMGQTASVEVAELTGCVIDPPQNVSKESEQKEAEMLPERGELRLKETSEMPRKGEEERCLKGLAESMENIKKNHQKAAEELSRTEEMLESIQRAREAEEAESVARSAARRVPGVELTKPEIMCRREHEGGDASGSPTPEKPRGLQPAESAVGEVSLTPEQTVKMTEVRSILTKSQKEAQEMPDCVTKLAEEIKQQRGSRDMEETVRAKGACVGEARKKLAHGEIPERIKDQGENTAERWDSVKIPVERP